MKSKKKYNCYLTTVYYGEEWAIRESREFLGVTWAVSEAQAWNNMRFRYKEAEGSGDLSRDCSWSRSIEVVEAPNTLPLGEFDNYTS